MNVEWRALPKFGARMTFEVWRLSDPPLLERTIDDAPIEWGFREMENGRILFPSGYNPNACVFDAVKGQTIFSLIDDPSQRRRPSMHPATLAMEGRRLLGGNPTTLFDVDTGAEMWKSEPHEQAEQATPSSSCFPVRESWHDLWKDRLPNWRYQTIAYRNSHSGELWFRTPSSAVTLTEWISERSLALAPDGLVYRTPFPINWPLLAFCQFVLALPMLLVWGAMSWRRKRKRRAALLQGGGFSRGIKTPS
jgi:hypothetical protein